MQHQISNIVNLLRASLLWVFLTVLICVASKWAAAQDIIWAKVYPLEKRDQITCITQDGWGDMYVGGYTKRNQIGIGQGEAILYKLDFNGDTLYSRYLNIKGEARSVVIDPEGMVRIGVTQRGLGVFEYNTILVRMTPEGLIFQRDTIYQNLTINSSIIGKDSSWIMVGLTPNITTGGWWDIFFQRIQKDGSIDPTVTLNPGHPDCGAYRVEQLPNGKYLISGHIGSRIVTYELDEWGLNPVYRQWYQTPNLSNLYSGHVSRINGQRYMLGAEGGPCIVGQYDSLLNKYWLKAEIGTQVPPQSMIDGSIVFGYKKGVPPYQVFYRVGLDSNFIWNLAIRDSMVVRGLTGNLTLKCFSYFADESAVVAGTYNGGINTTTQEDPFFIKISNVGTPVTSLSKPKKGPLQNETLAPWPNPSSERLYLKQHFDQAELRLYNLSGQEVARHQISFGQPADVSQLPPGLYLYRAVIDGKPFSGKVVKGKG